MPHYVTSVKRSKLSTTCYRELFSSSYNQTIKYFICSTFFFPGDGGYYYTVYVLDTGIRDTHNEFDGRADHIEDVNFAGDGKNVSYIIISTKCKRYIIHLSFNICFLIVNLLLYTKCFLKSIMNTLKYCTAARSHQETI